LPATIEWLTDNGSRYNAHDTKRFARDIEFEPRTTPPSLGTPGRVDPELQALVCAGHVTI
jgi:transposase InsO family protein